MVGQDQDTFLQCLQTSRLLPGWVAGNQSCILADRYVPGDHPHGWPRSLPVDQPGSDRTATVVSTVGL